MTTITATAFPAPTLSGLTVTNSVFQQGLELEWLSDAADGVFPVQIWRADSNNRASASVIATVFGNKHFDANTNAFVGYYWIRAVNKFGVANGDFYPSSPTAGISAMVILPWATGFNPINSVFSGTGSFVNVASRTLQNFTARTRFFNLTFSCWQVYGVLDKTTELEIRHFDGVTETVLYNYGVFSQKVLLPTFALQDFVVSSGTQSVVRLYWKGEDSTVQLKRPQIVADLVP